MSSSLAACAVRAIHLTARSSAGTERLILLRLCALDGAPRLDACCCLPPVVACGAGLAAQRWVAAGGAREEEEEEEEER